MLEGPAHSPLPRGAHGGRPSPASPNKRLEASPPPLLPGGGRLGVSEAQGSIVAPARGRAVRDRCPCEEGVSLQWVASPAPPSLDLNPENPVGGGCQRGAPWGIWSTPGLGGSKHLVEPGVLGDKGGYGGGPEVPRPACPPSMALGLQSSPTSTTKEGPQDASSLGCPTPSSLPREDHRPPETLHTGASTPQPLAGHQPQE